MSVTIDKEIYYTKLLTDLLSRFNLTNVLEINCVNYLVSMYRPDQYLLVDLLTL